MSGLVVAVCRNAAHSISKFAEPRIRLIEGLGVEGDTHAGVTVQHRSRVARDPSQRNLRQVHLLHAELHDELIAAGFPVSPGVMGENVLTRGVDLLGLPKDCLLHLGASAVVQVTGLRNPCQQLNGIQSGLMSATVRTGSKGELVRLAGVMGVVVAGGDVCAGDSIRVELPNGATVPLAPV